MEHLVVRAVNVAEIMDIALQVINNQQHLQFTIRGRSLLDVQWYTPRRQDVQQAVQPSEICRKFKVV
jgi:hypothetical protein